MSNPIEVDPDHTDPSDQRADDLDAEAERAEWDANQDDDS